jgi:hypothetical protein
VAIERIGETQRWLIYDETTFGIYMVLSMMVCASWENKSNRSAGELNVAFGTWGGKKYASFIFFWAFRTKRWLRISYPE